MVYQCRLILKKSERKPRKKIDAVYLSDNILKEDTNQIKIKSKTDKVIFAGDGPCKEWNAFVKSGIILTSYPEHVFVGMQNVGCGDCFYYSVLQLKDLSRLQIFTI